MSTEAVQREKPILFSGEMVRAILAGRKTQTRRPVTQQPKGEDGRFDVFSELRGPEWYEPTIVGRDGEEREGKPIFGIYSDDGEWGCQCPYEIGMQLWVRETWRWYGRYRNNLPEGGMEYRGDMAVRPFEDFSDPMTAWKAFDLAMIMGDANKWRPSIHMPRWASRLTLEIIGVKVERIQSIGDEDALEEGTYDVMSTPHKGTWNGQPSTNVIFDKRMGFAAYWDCSYGKTFPWKSDPWVWAVAFKVISPPTTP